MLGRRLLHAGVERALRRIQAVNGDLNAVVHAIESLPSSSAADGTERSRAVLGGVPVLVKDSIDVLGMPTVCGLEDRKDSGPVRTDAPLIARLRLHGAEIIGKTNVPAGCLDFACFNTVYGRTNNPYDLARTPGGSSGGSAAAVAAGMVELAIGSDLAGSLRVPASFCGVSSIKPTARRISPRGHVPPAACMQNNLTLGALSRDVRTLERFMQVRAARTSYDMRAWLWLCALKALMSPCVCRALGTTCAHTHTRTCTPPPRPPLSHALPLTPCLHIQAACAIHPGDEDAWEDVLPARPFKPMPELHPRDIRVVLTAELKGVPTDARIVRAMTSFGAVLDAAGVEVEYSQGPAFDNRCLFPEQRLRLASCVV